VVSSVYRWVGRPYVIEPVGLAAARQQLRCLSSKPELSKTVEAVKATCLGTMQVGVRHVRKRKEIK
jgi:hypothetical protein